MDRSLANEPASAHAPPARQSLRALLQRVVAGDQDAAQQLQERYGRYIVMAVRRRLPQQLRSKFDSLDFVQDVWVSFFRTADRPFESPEHLIAYLVRMARNKVADAQREGEATKRDARREEPLATQPVGQERQRVFDRDGTPSEAAIGRELWDMMMAGQPPAYRKVLMLLRDGRSQIEVAEQLNLNRRTVQRILSRALERTRS
jgi:RNA polymerase sigma factor (sigma-70 family)